jgi:hypothetical protein
MGCSSKDEIHCVTPGFSLLMPGMPMCMESRAACEAFRPAEPTRLDGATCIAVPRPDWHCWGMTGTADPVPYDTCLPSRELCESALSGHRGRENEDGSGSRATPCQPAATVACGVEDEKRSLVCQSSMLLCEAAEEMLTASLKGHKARRCEERHSAPAR